MMNLINGNKIRLRFVAPWVRTGMSFLNKNFLTSFLGSQSPPPPPPRTSTLNKNLFYSFLGAILASGLLFVSCTDKGSNKGSDGGVKYTLNVDTSTYGVVTSEPKGINCGSEGNVCKAEFSKDSKVTLTATVTDENYTPGTWGMDCADSGETCILEMTEDKIVTKSFNPPNKKTLIIPMPIPANGMITSDPVGIECGNTSDICRAKFKEGSEVKLIAKPNENHGQGAWGGACAEASADEVCKLNMDTGKTVTKSFTPPSTYEINIYGTGHRKGGRITSTPPGINCGGGNTNCGAFFAKDSIVTLTATVSSASYTIGEWGRDCEDFINETCELRMDRNKGVTKMFSKTGGHLPSISYTLNIIKPTNGKVTSDFGGIDCGGSNTDCNAQFNEGVKITLTAIKADPNYTLGDWGLSCTGSGETCILEMTEDKTVTKIINRPDKYTITIARLPKGKIISQPPGIDCGGGDGKIDCSADFSSGIDVTLTATASTKYTLGDWEEDCAGYLLTTCTLTMDENKTVTKLFSTILYTLTITKPTNSTITSDPAGINCGDSNTTCEAQFGENTDVTLMATTKVGYTLGAWGGACSSATTRARCTVNMNADKDASKVSSLNRYTLTITKPKCGDIKSREGLSDSYMNCGRGNVCTSISTHGSEVRLQPVGFANYVASAWGDACNSVDIRYSDCNLTMDGNKIVSAEFTPTTADSDDDCIVDDDGDDSIYTDDIDDDNDGLIEIHNLDMFSHIRYNSDGTSYKTAVDATDNRMGAPTQATDNCTAATTDGVYLCGYELMGDLDFAEGASYADGSVNTDWRPNNPNPDSATNAGFLLSPNYFGGIFEGNGNSISNLYRNTSDAGSNSGLFGYISTRAVIRNLGVVNARFYIDLDNATNYAGGLAGISLGSIVSCYAEGISIISKHKLESTVFGGLVGENRGSILTSFATGAINVNNGSHLGGLVGSNNGGNIMASYAVVDVLSRSNNSKIGGLVGHNKGSIRASYAKGNVTSNGASIPPRGEYIYDAFNTPSTSTSPSSFPSKFSGTSYIGGLVGHNDAGSIKASYTIVAVNGDTKCFRAKYIYIGSEGKKSGLGKTLCPGIYGRTNYIGALVGRNQNGGSISTSYRFGSVDTDKKETPTLGGTMRKFVSDAGAPPRGVRGPSQLTADNAGSEWNSKADETLGAWDFGKKDTQLPILNYADYDDYSRDVRCPDGWAQFICSDGLGGNAYDCDMFPYGTCNTPLPGQERETPVAPYANATNPDCTIDVKFSDISTIMVPYKCIWCHGGNDLEGDYSLTSKVNAIRNGSDSIPNVAKGNPWASFLFMKVWGSNNASPRTTNPPKGSGAVRFSKDKMPFECVGNKCIDTDQNHVNAFFCWIAQGAK